MTKSSARNFGNRNHSLGMHASTLADSSIGIKSKLAKLEPIERGIERASLNIM